MIERDPKAAAQLKQHLELLNASGGEVINQNALSWLEFGNQGAPYHIVFIDPPFQLKLWQRVIDELERGNWLADNATIYLESGREDEYLPPVNWQLHRDKHAGAISYRLFYREQPGS
jgi:16S rRNA (guanine966-N2)-methyltransferase